MAPAVVGNIGLAGEREIVIQGQREVALDRAQGEPRSVEGPSVWSVRPVAEIFTERAAGSARINSRLVGVIWRLRDGLSFDAGLRHAQAGDEPVHELRLGLTWAFPLRKEP